MRCTVVPIHNANSSLSDALEMLWARKTPSDALSILSKPDVRVTNLSDKQMQLPKIGALSKTVSNAWIRAGRDEELGGAFAFQGPFAELLKRPLEPWISRNPSGSRGPPRSIQVHPGEEGTATVARGRRAADSSRPSGLTVAGRQERPRASVDRKQQLVEAYGK